MASAEYYGKEFPTAHPDAVRCTPCERWFIPDDNQIHVVRQSWNEPGAVVCPECIEYFKKVGLVERDETKLKCICGTLDKTLQETPCPVHENLVVVPPSVH